MTTIKVNTEYAQKFFADQVLQGKNITFLGSSETYITYRIENEKEYLARMQELAKACQIEETPN